MCTNDRGVLYDTYCTVCTTVNVIQNSMIPILYLSCTVQNVEPNGTMILYARCDAGLHRTAGAEASRQQKEHLGWVLHHQLPEKEYGDLLDFS